MKDVDSILEAAKKVAAALHVPWPEIQKVYRGLQEDDAETKSAWLPKSKGRQIWYANPNFVSRIIVSFAFSDADRSYHDAVFLSYGLASEGHPFQTDFPSADSRAPVEDCLSEYLSNPEAASRLRKIEFMPAEKQIAFVEEKREEVFFLSEYPGDDLFAKRILGQQQMQSAKRIAQAMAISGDAIKEMAEVIKMKPVSCPPFGNHTDEASD